MTLSPKTDFGLDIWRLRKSNKKSVNYNENRELEATFDNSIWQRPLMQEPLALNLSMLQEDE